MNPAIELHDVRRHFGKTPVLRGLSFAVEKGETYALLGRNGAGKSTALNILMGFLAPMSGRAAVLGIESDALTPADRERIGYVSEGQKPYETMLIRVGDLLTFEASTRERFDRKYAEDALRRFQLPKDKVVSALSRGQRAQLALVMAMAGRPEVLVFDDPAMGLDVVMRRELLGSVIEYFADEGCAILFSSHILSEVERVADRVGILHGGQLIVDASLVELKRRVQKRFLRGANGDEPALADLPGLLRAQPARDGFELTLLDMDEERERALLARGGALGEPYVPSLEELFCDLTTVDTGSEQPIAEGAVA